MLSKVSALNEAFVRSINTMSANNTAIASFMATQ
jgi:hypothetical protein